jgi:solute carrier family 38 (sodium-coupled neutral amino acid transporter), member 9
MQTSVFRITSGTLLFIVGVIYFQLINLTLFPIVTFIMEKSGFTNYAEPSDGIVFDKYLYINNIDSQFNGKLSL